MKPAACLLGLLLLAPAPPPDRTILRVRTGFVGTEVLFSATYTTDTGRRGSVQALPTPNEMWIEGHAFTATLLPHGDLPRLTVEVLTPAQCYGPTTFTGPVRIEKDGTALRVTGEMIP
jgi:hypothetical protein